MLMMAPNPFWRLYSPFFDMEITNTAIAHAVEDSSLRIEW